MFAREIGGINLESGQINAVDEVLRRELDNTYRIRTAVPVKMYGPAASRIEPLDEGASEGRATALAKLWEPDEDISVLEELAKRGEFPVGCRICIFSQDHAGDVSTRSTDYVLKRRDQRREYTRVEFDYYLLTRLKLKSVRDSASAFFVVGLNHGCFWIGLYGVILPSNASGLLPPMPERWIVPARWRVRNPIFGRLRE